MCSMIGEGNIYSNSDTRTLWTSSLSDWTRNDRGGTDTNFVWNGYNDKTWTNAKEFSERRWNSEETTEYDLLVGRVAMDRTEIS